MKLTLGKVTRANELRLLGSILQATPDVIKISITVYKMRRFLVTLGPDSL